MGLFDLRKAGGFIEHVQGAHWELGAPGVLQEGKKYRIWESISSDIWIHDICCTYLVLRPICAHGSLWTMRIIKIIVLAITIIELYMRHEMSKKKS
jgi:hypothetical protein